MEKEHYQKGIHKAKIGNYTEAIKEFTEAIEINPKFADAYYRRGLAYSEIEQFDKAIADYNSSLNLNTRQIEVYFSRASALLAADNIQGSIMDIQAILTLDSNYVRAYKLWAKICIRLQEFDRAIEHYKTAGEIYLDRKDKEGCSFCIAKIRHIEQQKIAAQGGVTNDAFLKQVKQKIQQGRFTEAFADCNWLLQLDSYDAQAYYYRGNISIRLGAYEQAKTDLRKASQYFRSQGKIAESEKMERICVELQLKDAYSETTANKSTRSFTRTRSPQNALQYRLYRLVDNWNIAQGLVEGLKLSHPGMSENWYWEKAIYEIERDRL
ncbi:MAG: tetratricopeptide repeat protein [Xenococcaceae cyanobacterium MO_167.B27]|nr:tetratricopeptide repeat protein [Xenococcaceae cyanobacterium MO_167.B27]